MGGLERKTPEEALLRYFFLFKLTNRGAYLFSDDSLWWRIAVEGCTCYQQVDSFVMDCHLIGNVSKTKVNHTKLKLCMFASAVELLKVI